MRLKIDKLIRRPPTSAGGVEVFDKINEALEGAELKGAASITVSQTQTLNANAAALKFLLDKADMVGVVLCLECPPSQISRLLGRKGLNLEGIFFIDAITFGGRKAREVSPNALHSGTSRTRSIRKESENIVFVEDPSNLKSLEAAIPNAIESLRGRTKSKPAFLMVDCLTSLCNYRSQEEVESFVRDTIPKLEVFDIFTVITLIGKSGTLTLNDAVREFCGINIYVTLPEEEPQEEESTQKKETIWKGALDELKTHLADTHLADKEAAVSGLLVDESEKGASAGIMMKTDTMVEEALRRAERSLAALEKIYEQKNIPESKYVELRAAAEEIIEDLKGRIPENND